MTLEARVRAGRLIVDEPTDLPEGTEVELIPLDPGDWLDEDSRAALHRALLESEEDVKAGRLIDADASCASFGRVDETPGSVYVEGSRTRPTREGLVAPEP